MKMNAFIRLLSLIGSALLIAPCHYLKIFMRPLLIILLAIAWCLLIAILLIVRAFVFVYQKIENFILTLKK